MVLPLFERVTHYSVVEYSNLLYTDIIMDVVLRKYLSKVDYLKMLKKFLKGIFTRYW